MVVGVRPAREWAAKSLIAGSAQLHRVVNRIQFFKTPVQLYRGTTTPDQQNLLLLALTCSSQVDFECFLFSFCL